MRTQFPDALADRTPGAGDGCPVWYVNSWADIGLWAGPARHNFLILPSKHTRARAAAAQFTHLEAHSM